MSNRLIGLVLAGMIGVGGVAGYQWVRAQVAADIYRERLAEVKNNYDQLRSHYNDAVSRTAVTELQVQDGEVSVRVRNAAGEAETISTPYSADSEIFVDYVVLDGRLMIRRVFDENTPPNQGVLIDSKLTRIDWDRAGAMHGKAAYRRLSDGRWVVTVTGDGSLGLGRASEDADLVRSPTLGDFEPIEQAADVKVREIGPLDVFHALFQ